MPPTRVLRSATPRVQKPRQVTSTSNRNARSTSSQRSRLTRATRSRASVASIDLDLLEEKLTSNSRQKRKSDNITSPNVQEETDPDTDSASDTSDDEEAYSSSSTSTSNSVEDLPTHLIEQYEQHLEGKKSRNASYDSRFEPGNEDYELDDFVVDDASDLASVASAASSSSSPLTEFLDSSPIAEAPGAGHKQRRLVRRPRPRAPSTIPSPSPSLPSPSLPCAASRRRCSVIISPPSPHIPTKLTAGAKGAKAANILILSSPSDIVEEIEDALTKYSRRCNRNQPPTTLVLGLDALTDGDVLGSLREAVRLGLGRIVGLSGEGEGEVWVIGPRG